MIDVALKEAAEVLVVIKSRKTGPSGFQALVFCLLGGLRSCFANPANVTAALCSRLLLICMSGVKLL